MCGREKEKKDFISDRDELMQLLKEENMVLEFASSELQNMSDEEFAISVVLPKEAFEEQTCIGCCNNCKNEPCIVGWLKSEHKEPIKLSDAERIILENIDKEYGYIARDRTGCLTVFYGVPRKGCDIWESRGFKHCYINCFNHLFQFITWEDGEPYNIEELLKGE